MKRSLIKKILIAFGVVVLIIFGVFVATLRMNYVVPVLMYHSVHPDAHPDNRLSVSVESFERQMRFLRTHNYNVVTVAEIARMLDNGERIPPKTVAVTFDDGYKDNFEYAFPVLRKYHIPATLFVIIDELGRPQGDRLSWEDVLRMKESGLVAIGSHCLGPEPLVNITSEVELRRQIFESRRLLEKKLGIEIEVFSYPEGRFNEFIRGLVREAGYSAAVATSPGRDYPDTDVFALKRVRISATSDNLFVFWFESSGYYTFMKEHRHK